MKIKIYILLSVFLPLCQKMVQASDLENIEKVWSRCYVDFCSWEKYCDHVSRRCEDCSTRFLECFTPKQDVNCIYFCIKYQPCPPLGPLLYGHHNGSDGQEYRYGSILSFTCDEGYQNTGVNITFCQFWGTWSHLKPDIKQPTCKVHKCIIPHQPDHGRVEFSPNTTEFVAGSQISYSCDTGYKLHGKHSNRTCQTNGTWSGTVPECVENKCRIPRPPDHGRVEFSPNTTEFVAGSRVSYSCVAGYKLHGKYSNRTCQTNGTWSGTVPECDGPSINWKIADILPWTVVILILGILIFICLKCRRKGKKYEKILETKDQNEELELGEESLETTIPHEDDVTVNTKKESKNVHSLKEQKRAVSPTSEPSQVVVKMKNCGHVSLYTGNNNKVSKTTKETNYNAHAPTNNQIEESKSVENPVTITAVEETDRTGIQDTASQPYLYTDGIVDDKISEGGLETVMPDNSENDDHLIAYESTSL